MCRLSGVPGKSTVFNGKRGISNILGILYLTGFSHDNNQAIITIFDYQEVIWYTKTHVNIATDKRGC
jgi:hypothetical protein